MNGCILAVIEFVNFYEYEKLCWQKRILTSRYLKYKIKFSTRILLNDSRFNRIVLKTEFLY